MQGRKIYIHKKDGKVTDYYDKLNNFEQHEEKKGVQDKISYSVSPSKHPAYKNKVHKALDD